MKQPSLVYIFADQLRYFSCGYVGLRLVLMRRSAGRDMSNCPENGPRMNADSIRISANPC